MSPLAVDLFTGLHGWAEGLVAEGWRVVGFDLEDMCAQFGTMRPRDVQLVLQDVRTIHGSQFARVDLIVASPPCQAYSYRAMPWKRARALPPPDNTLFEACFRIQREAMEASGRFIPLVVENVCGAQKWVGRAKYHFGSFYLWGDVPALMPPHAERHIKGNGGSWFNVAHNTTSGKGQNPTKRGDGIKQGGGWFGAHGQSSILRRTGSKSTARKAASAHIAKIPFPLARWIARAWWPEDRQEGTA